MTRTASPASCPAGTLRSAAQGLGVFSLALGVAELLAPRALARMTGMPGRETLIRACGLREIVNGIGLLASVDPRPWLWSRVAGDALDLSTLALRPGTHQFALTLPLGCVLVDVFRALNGDKVIPAQILIDGQDTANKRLLNWFDGRVHIITIVAADPFTHFEAQAATTLESVYFEFPKQTKSTDINLFEKTEPFQIIMKPEVPQLDTLDIIAESQTNKFLIVQTTND